MAGILIQRTRRPRAPCFFLSLTTLTATISIDEKRALFAPIEPFSTVSLMSCPRFFINEPDEFFSGRIELPPKAAKHAGRSLRLAAGEIVEVFNGKGRLWRGPIGFTPDSAWVDVEEVPVAGVESPLRITLLQSFVSPEKTEWIVEKAVEAGVYAIVLVPAARSVTRLSGDRLEKRLQRLREIARAAAEQCGRNVIPEISAKNSLSTAFETVESSIKLILAPCATPATLHEKLTPGLESAAIAVGPEGGFSKEEIEIAEKAGWIAQLLGPRVLRTETAGLAATVWLQTIAGDYPRP